MRSENEKSIGLLKELEEKHGGKITAPSLSGHIFLVKENTQTECSYIG